VANPRRVGSLERDKPTSPVSETLKWPRTVDSSPGRGTARGEAWRRPMPCRWGGAPWRGESPGEPRAPFRS